MSVSEMYALEMGGFMRRFDHRVQDHLRQVINGDAMPCEYHPGTTDVPEQYLGVINSLFGLDVKPDADDLFGTEVKPHLYDRKADLLAKLDKVDALQDEAARLIEEVALAIP